MENTGHGARFSDSVPTSDSESRGKSKGSFWSRAKNLFGRLQKVGRIEVPGRVDEKVPNDVSKIHTMKTTELPKSREEILAESTFEWVKTERAGDVSKFKELKIENNVEYLVFQDNTRVNTALLGDVILQHRDPSAVLGAELRIEKPTAEVKSNPQPISRVQTAATFTNPTTQSSYSAITAILDKAKKKKKKVQFELVMDIPSADVLSIVRDNFDASDEDLFEFFVEKIDKKKFVASIIAASINK